MSLKDRLEKWITTIWLALIDLKDWHEYAVDKWIDRFNISQYASLWISFFKGVATVLLLQWLF